METIECYKGDSWEIEMTIADENGDPISGIENYEAIYSLSKRPTGSDLKNEIASDDVTLTVSVLGVVTGTVGPDITKLVDTGKYVEQIRMADATGAIVQTFERYRNVKSVNYIPPVVVP